jgi:nitroreductase
MVGAADEPSDPGRHQGRSPLIPAGVTAEAVARIVDAGARAPSGDNCQPWRFGWDGDALRISFSPERAASLYDVDHVASWVSLGAVLANMKIAAGHIGLRLSVELFPADEPSPIVARAALRPAEPENDPLAPVITERSVNRRAYARTPLPRAIRDELGAVASRAGLHLWFVESGSAMRQLAALAAQNDRILFENQALRRGLYRWLRWTRRDIARMADGMPIATLELGWWERPGFRALNFQPLLTLLSVFGVTRALPRRAARIYRRSAAIALLAAGDDGGPIELVRGGEVLERIWLTASLRGLAFQPITGLTFLLLRMARSGGDGLSLAHRRLLHRLGAEFERLMPEARGATPIMLFRIGVAPPPSARAPRLPVAELLSMELERPA